MPNGQPTPGGQDQENFWKRNQKMLVRIIIVAIIIVGAVVYSQTQEEQENGDQVAQNGNEEEQNGEVNGNGDINVIDGTEEENGDVMEEEQDPIRTEGETITVVVQRGEGYTHTARRALAEYLRANPNEQITAEHKIYVEDYLQKRIAEKERLFSGNEVGYSEGEIQAAVDAALDLTEPQIDNLSKYVPLVPSLN